MLGNTDGGAANDRWFKPFLEEELDATATAALMTASASAAVSCCFPAAMPLVIDADGELDVRSVGAYACSATRIHSATAASFSFFIFSPSSAPAGATDAYAGAAPHSLPPTDPSKNFRVSSTAAAARASSSRFIRYASTQAASHRSFYARSSHTCSHSGGRGASGISGRWPLLTENQDHIKFQCASRAPSRSPDQASAADLLLRDERDRVDGAVKSQAGGSEEAGSMSLLLLFLLALLFGHGYNLILPSMVSIHCARSLKKVVTSNLLSLPNHVLLNKNTGPALNS